MEEHRVNWASTCALPKYEYQVGVFDGLERYINPIQPDNWIDLWSAAAIPVMILVAFLFVVVAG